MSKQDQWTVRDVLLGGVFLAVGLMAIAYATLAKRNGVPAFLWSTAWIVGPLLLALGVNATYKALRSARGAQGPNHGSRSSGEASPRG